MKTKNTFLLTSLAFAVGALFWSCEVPTPSANRIEKDGYSIVEIDSCEYIEVSYGTGANYGYYSLTHKGNCKYCVERNKK